MRRRRVCTARHPAEPKPPRRMAALKPLISSRLRYRRSLRLRFRRSPVCSPRRSPVCSLRPLLPHRRKRRRPPPPRRRPLRRRARTRCRRPPCSNPAKCRRLHSSPGRRRCLPRRPLVWRPPRHLSSLVRCRCLRLPPPLLRHRSSPPGPSRDPQPPLLRRRAPRLRPPLLPPRRTSRPACPRRAEPAAASPNPRQLRRRLPPPRAPRRRPLPFGSRLRRTARQRRPRPPLRHPPAPRQTPR